MITATMPSSSLPASLLTDLMPVPDMHGAAERFGQVLSTAGGTASSPEAEPVQIELAALPLESATTQARSRATVAKPLPGNGEPASNDQGAEASDTGDPLEAVMTLITAFFLPPAAAAASVQVKHAPTNVPEPSSAAIVQNAQALRNVATAQAVPTPPTRPDVQLGTSLPTQLPPLLMDTKYQAAPVSTDRGVQLQAAKQLVSPEPATPATLTAALELAAPAVTIASLKIKPPLTTSASPVSTPMPVALPVPDAGMKNAPPEREQPMPVTRDATEAPIPAQMREAQLAPLMAMARTFLPSFSKVVEKPEPTANPKSDAASSAAASSLGLILPSEATLSASTQSTFTSGPAVAPLTATSAAPSAQPEMRELDLARDLEWLDSLAKDIVAAAQSEDRLSFRLMPKELGRLDVNVSTSDAGLNVKMLTSSEEARAAVAAHQPRLVEELRGQGIRVAGAEVSTGDQQDSRRKDSAAAPFIETSTINNTPSDEASNDRPLGRFA